MYCKKCGKELSDNSEFCQYCGAKQNEVIAQEEDKKPNGCLTAFMCVIFVIIILFAISAIIPTKPIQDDDDKQQSLARALSQQEVEQYLTYPKKAEFAKGSEYGYKKIENMHYLVQSYVYAPNQFGGMVRYDFLCDVKLINDNEGKVNCEIN